MYRRYALAMRQLAAQGCHSFKRLAHGAGRWSIEYRTVEGKLEVQYL